MDLLPIPNKLDQQLNYYAHKHFNGRLQARHVTGLSWELYFCQGRLVWATGGTHPLRRLYRHVGHFCPAIDLTMEVSSIPGLRSWDYDWLAMMTREQRINRQQAIGVIENVIAEVLFDILQAEVGSLTYSMDRHYSIDAPLAVLHVERIHLLAQQAWENWGKHGLADRSPNLVPVLHRPDQLRASVSEVAYQNLSQLINGQRTLRDLSLIIHQELVLTTRSLLPYVTQGLIGLTEIGDFFSEPRSSVAGSRPAAVPIAESVQTVAKATRVTSGSGLSKPVGHQAPLVACIDDSPLVGQQMEHILQREGYRSLYIPDSLTAIPQLLQHKPDLIVLDLVMPVANGYEVCAQIRRIAAFRHTPIVILTSNDGLVDRVRAKMVGSSDFLAKPVDPHQLLELLHKHLDPSQLIVSQLPHSHYAGSGSRRYPDEYEEPIISTRRLSVTA